MITKYRNILIVMTMIASGVILYGTSDALQAPHDTTRSVDCSGCHPKPGFNTLTSIETFCYANCHNPSASAAKKVISPLNPSNRFNSLPAGSYKQSSHGWDIPNTNTDAGATNNWQPAQPFAALKTKVYCSRCHRAHGSTGIAPFLRDYKKGDKICLNCHAARQITNVRDPLPSGKHFSHPVEVNYSTARASKPDFFETSPQLASGYNESARPRLYTTIGGTKGAVVCSTCHGPLHSADSNPYTFDSLSTYSKTNNYSSSAGNLLRQYDTSRDTANNLCKSCHKVTTHKGYNCYRCHTPHKKAGENNRYLILENISTPFSGKRAVQFVSTSAMAKRWAEAGNAPSTGICQVCHTGTEKAIKYHWNYSTPSAKRDHNYLGSSKYKNCAGCHLHTSGFLPTGAAACGTCHKAPPDDAKDGKHGKHTDGNASYNWSDGTLSDARTAGSYGFSCGRCHNPYSPYTALRHYPAGFDDSAPKGYTTEYGFNIRSDQPLPKNPNASYTRAASGASDEGANTGGSRWSWSSGTCSNLYCHGQFYNGFTSNNPTWNGTQNCGACHGAKRSDPPGKTGGVNWGAHPRHVGSANSQQYGFSGWKFGCSACHYPTTMSSITSIDDRSTHVDGRVTLEFNGGGYGDANSTYNGFADYTGRKPSMSKPAYNSCGLIYCHSDGSRMSNYSAPWNAGIGSGTGRFPNWSSSRNFTTTVSGTKRRCARCHGSNYNGITAFMPGYDTRPGKGNSHKKHVVDNGFMCNVCHDNTVNTDNKSIKSTTYHVNKTYDVNVISKYVVGTFQFNADKTCSNVECHGNRLTPAWGNTAVCKDCHFKSTAEVTADEGYNDSYTWRNMTTTASMPRIYSSEWVTSGHGRSSGIYPSGNAGANKTCTNCHKASGSKSHQSEMTNNPFRVFTAPSHIDDLCQQCHSSSKPNAAGGGADRKVITHYTTGWGDWGNAKWPFMPKCIDCHDPHGDNNRYMIQKYINFTGSDSLGKVANSNYVRQVTFTTVGSNTQLTWSSYVKSDFTGICQRCHNTQADMKHFNKAAGASDQGYDAGHNAPNRCTGCHKHDTGFKGLDCGQCHYFPPTLSGRHSFHVATSVAKSYVDYAPNSTKTKYAYGCGKCHNSGNHIGATQNVYTAEVVFDAANTLPRNKDANAQYVFGAKSSIDDGASTTDSYKWASTKGTCRNLYCHGQFFGGYSGNDPNWYGTQPCGKCHGAVKNSSNAPTGGAHSKHVTTYGFKCRFCHRDTTGGFDAYTVANRTYHVNGITDIRLYTTESRIQGNARYGNAGSEYINVTTNTNPGVVPTYRFCKNIYCHSNGTSTTSPFALSNYTAKWGQNLAADFPNAGKRCSYCHGNKTYEGITAAMPMQSGQAHKKHVVDNGFTRCYTCHSNVVDSNNQIASTANHVNRFKNISVIMTYRTGDEAYDPAGAKRCSNIKCHGGRITPAWSASATCQDCHYASSGAASAEDSFTWQNFSGASAKIYSTEWTKRGHGKASGSGSYPFSGNNAAGKNCANCHNSAVSHNDGANPFRLANSNPDTLCLSCHGSGAGQLTGAYGNATGIQSHTWANMSTNGYKGGVSGKAGWNFTPKCVDCHDPHGDKNNYMVHSYINMTGSDSYGRPTQQDTALMNFTAVKGGTSVNWSSFVRSDNKGICQRCHSSEVANFNKTTYSNHNSGKRCTDCHKHRKGFTPAGCDTCHGYPPPNGPSGWNEDSAVPSTVGAHTPHARNPKGRPGIPAENDLPADKGYNCNRCHGNSSNGQGTGHSTYTTAVMQQMTSLYGKWSKGGTSGKTSVSDDTCWSVRCHTPRSYTRTWKKPADCDDCHGYRKGKGASERVFNLQTTQSHKMHINYTGTTNLPATWKKNYNFACSNCHYDWQTINNYSTHYSSQVNITSNGPVNKVGGQFYNRGRSFKGFSTGNELTNSSTTCSKVYCHGNFINGTTATLPSWKKGVTTVSCTACHKGKLTGGDGSTMPGKHPKHVSDSQGYGFACVRCHSWTTNNITTVIFNYSSHVNGRKDINFNNLPFDQTAGKYSGDATRKCSDLYCHSKGNRTSGWVGTDSYPNYTANWGDTLGGYRTGQKCKYCHGSKTGFTGITAAMPNYASGSPKANRHPIHVAPYGFTCTACHVNVTVNNTSIDASGGRSNHVNNSYNVNFNSGVKRDRGYGGIQETINNSGGGWNWIDAANGGRCENTYCHSKGTKYAEPYNVSAHFSIYTAKWGADRGSYKKTAGLMAKCNFCHGNKDFSGITSAMPNYISGSPKANSHFKHVKDNGIVCSTCHYGVAMNNTSISDAARHVNKFYNISIAPGFRAAVGKTYSMVYDGSGGTCKNNTCHGSTAAPKWGGTVTCRNCHMRTTGGDLDDYGTVNDSAAKIYSTEYMNTGHGRTTAYPYSGNPGAAKDCTNCHKSTVGHKNPANPYRLYTSDPDAFCGGCHGTASERNTSWPSPDATKVDYKTHSKANILDVYGADATWPPVFQNEKAKCVDCHDPHGDKNRYMVHALINYSGSGTYGQPQNYSPAAVMNFTSVGGAQFNWSSYVRNDYSRICQRCHNTQTAMKNFNKAAGAADQGYNAGHNPGKRCTSCHSHKNGFGPAESSGNQSCKDCHVDLFNPMNSQAKSYHHVMQNTTATGANKYPMSNNIGDPDVRRRCLMCHVDHNVFRPDMNGNDPRGRAANLRANVFTWPTSNVASTRNNSDWSGTDSRGGICLSCHTIAQSKNTTKQFSDNSTKTLRLYTSLYRNTPHNYTAVGVIKKDGSQFKANCLKCHNDTMAKTKWQKFGNTSGFGLHDSKLRRINSQFGLQIYDGTASGGSTTTLVQTGAGWTAGQWKQRVVTITSGTGVGQTRVIFDNTVDTLTIVGSWTAPASGSTFTIGDPPEEDYCYNCHSQSSNPNGSDAAGNKDYYGMVKFVNTKALKMEQTFSGDSGTATGGSTTTIVDTTKAWITSPSQQWAGYIVKIIGGTNAGQERTIASHTATEITISGAPFKKAIDTTSKYAIGNPFRHRIDQFSGRHKSDEAVSNTGSTATPNGWFADTGTGTHVGCADCHNPHSQRKPGAAQGKSRNNDAYTTTTTIYDDGSIGGTKSWGTGQWRGYVMVAVDRSQAGEERMIVSNTGNTFRVAAPFSVRMTGVYYNILPKARAYVATSRTGEVGNALNGPNNGQWGVKVTKWDKPAPNTTTAEFNNLSAPTFSKVTTLYSLKNKTHELCLKCHSNYGWGTSGTRFRAMDVGLSALGVYTGGVTTDISKEVNPNNLAHHALIEPGKNQPIVANYGTSMSSVHNPNWPYYSTAGAGDTLTIDASGIASFAGVANLPLTAIPGWFVWVGTADAPPTAPTAGSASSGWFQITEIISATSFKVTPATAVSATANWAVSAGLGNNFVPPYGPWSVINCADCHDTDASGDPSGPHGSGRNWLLRKMEPQTFLWMDGNATYKVVSWTNQGWASKYAANLLCLNCHRADIYGADGNNPNGGTLPDTTGGGYQNFAWRASLSRQPHSPESTVNAYAAPNGTTDGGDGNTFRMVCMHCHAGDGMGSIHGTNKGASLDNAGAVVTTGRAYRGKRFLVGGSWNGIIRGTTAAAGTCYTNGRTTDDAINVCNRSEGKAMANVATYNYEAATDY